MRGSRWVVACSIAAACGRFGLDDAVDHAGDAPVTGADGGAPGCVPTGPELCNGVDDNCNGEIDEGCPCAPFDVSFPSAYVDAVGLVWTGSGYISLVGNGSDVTLGAVDGSGALGPNATVASTTAAVVPTGPDVLAWSGSELAIVTAPGQGALVFASYTGDLTPVATVPLGVQGSAPHVTWAGDRYGVAWSSDGGSAGAIGIVELGRDGTALGAAARIDLDSAATVQSIAPIAGGYMLGVATAGAASVVVVTRPSLQGAPATLAVSNQLLRVVPGPGGALATGFAPGLAPTLQMVDAAGVPGAAVTVPDDPGSAGTPYFYFAAVAAEGHYQVAGYSSGVTHDVWLTEIDGSGNVIPPAVPLFSFSASEYGEASAVHAYQRTGLALVYTPANAPHNTRLVQLCR